MNLSHCLRQDWVRTSDAAQPWSSPITAIGLWQISTAAHIPVMSRFPCRHLDARVTSGCTCVPRQARGRVPCLLQCWNHGGIRLGCHLVIGIGQDNIFQLPSCQGPIGVTRLEESDQAIIEAVIVAKNERD